MIGDTFGLMVGATITSLGPASTPRLTVRDVVAAALTCRVWRDAVERWAIDVLPLGYDLHRTFRNYTDDVKYWKEVMDWGCCELLRYPGASARASVSTRLRVAFTCYCGITSWAVATCDCAIFCHDCDRRLPYCLTMRRIRVRYNKYTYSLLNVMDEFRTNVCRFGCGMKCKQCGCSINNIREYWKQECTDSQDMYICAKCCKNDNISDDMLYLDTKCRTIGLFSYVEFDGVPPPVIAGFEPPPLAIVRIYDPTNPRL